MHAENTRKWIEGHPLHTRTANERFNELVMLMRFYRQKTVTVSMNPEFLSRMTELLEANGYSVVVEGSDKQGTRVTVSCEEEEIIL